MEAGRELDALVAEKVMGWKRQTDFDYHPPIDFWHGERVREAAGWCPSTDIANAWEVIETFDNSLIVREVPEEGGRWRVNLRASIGVDIEDAKFDAYAPTAPLAICLAALKAVQP